MQFSGFWISRTEDAVQVVSHIFDETELSDYSGWQEAWQNADTDSAHGYINPLAALQSVSRNIAGELSSLERDQLLAAMRSGDPMDIQTIGDLARLIQLLLPTD
jgi:hypothetical protein